MTSTDLCDLLVVVLHERLLRVLEVLMFGDARRLILGVVYVVDVHFLLFLGDGLRRLDVAVYVSDVVDDVLAENARHNV